VAKSRAESSTRILFYFILAASAAVCGFFASNIVQFFGSMCANRIVDSTLSPDGRHEAVLFERDCGATTDFSSQVAVIPYGTDLPNIYGNVFMAEPHGNPRRAPWGGPRVAIRWQSADHLVVTYDKNSHIYRRETKIGDVSVSYQTD